MKKLFTFLTVFLASTLSVMAQTLQFGDNLNTNSDFEGDEFEWVAVKPSLLNGESNGNILQGADVAKCIKSNEEGKFLEVVSGANPSQPWDAQIWIKLPEDIQTGEHVIISFRYRADIGDEGVESLSVGTQGHKAPGDYLNNTGLGDLEFSREWKTFTNEENPFTVPASQKSIAFNLSVNKDYVAAFCFDDLVIRREKAEEGWEDYWKPVVTNGDLESDACPNFITATPGVGQKDAIPQAGEGYEGSAGIKMHVPAKVSENYDSQFFIKLNEPIPAGDIIRVFFRYKQSENLDETALVDSWRDHQRIGAQAHAMPGGYITWNAGFYELEGTTEWKIYEGDFQISDEASPSNNFQTIAFNLSITDHDYDLYFDDFVVKHKVKVPAGTNPARLALEEYIAELDTKYYSMTAFSKAKQDVVDDFLNAYGEAQAAQDGDDYEALYDNLIKAESRYNSSVKDYTALKNYMDMITEKGELAAANFPDLKAELDDEVTKLLDESYNPAELGREEINALINEQMIYDKVNSHILANMKSGDDVSAMIINPNYNFGNTGWNGGVTVNDGAAERYHTSFDVNQTVKGLKKGAYEIVLNGFQRIDDGGNDNAQLYANDATKLLVNRDLADDAFEGDAPNDMGSAAAAFAEGCYKNVLSAILTKDGDMKIGVKGTDGNIWVIWDQFRLIYKGEDKATMAQAIKDQVEAVEQVEFNLEFDELLNTATVKKTNDLIDAGNAMAKNINTASEAEINEMIDKLVAMIAEMQEVSKVVQTVKDSYTEFSNVYDEYYDEATEANKARADKVVEICNSVEGFLSLSTDELKDFAAEMVDLTGAIKIKAAAYDATDAAPFDFTYLFENPDFEDFEAVGANKNYPGWKGSGFGTGGGSAGPVAERWNTSSGFDTYVDFAYLPAGTYALTCDGATRYGGNGDILVNDYAILNGERENDKPVYLYAQTSIGTDEALMHNICEGKMTVEEAEKIVNTDENSNIIKITIDEVDYFVPDQLSTADSWIKAGKYLKNEVIFKVPEDGKARVGIKKASGVGNDWMFADNFQLTYFGANSEKVPTAIETVETAAPSVAAQGIYSISGVRLNKVAGKGLYIINGKKVMK